MRRVFSLVSVGLLVLMASVVQAQAQVFNLTAALSGSSETPPVVTGAFGSATVTVDMATQTVTYAVTVFNMPTGTTASHFHVGGPALAGPTVVNFTPATGISNDYSFSGTATTLSNARAEQGIRSWEDFLQALLGGNTYINVHSTANPGGEIRGQVIRVP